MLLPGRLRYLNTGSEHTLQFESDLKRSHVLIMIELNKRSAIKTFLPIALSIVFLVMAVSSCEKENAPLDETRTRIVMLGTGTPNAEPDRSGSSVAIIVDDIPYIIDAGPGVVRRANAAVEKGITGLAPPLLNRLFITHLHTDHTAGIADFIFTPWVLERDVPVEIYGPPGIAEMTSHILQAYKEDVRVRLEGLEPANPSGYLVNAHEIDPGILPAVIYTDSLITVTAFPVKHGAWPQAYGYRFVTPDRVIVISGGTIPMESLVKQAKGADVLIHEVYSQAGFERRTPFWQQYHAGSHTSSIELAQIATRVRPGLVILYHQLLWGSTPEELLAEISDIYDGRVVYGNDLDIF